MGRTTTPTYVVSMTVPGYRLTPAAWRVRRQYQIPGNGQPTNENLEKYVRDFEESTRPGGCNAHLGPTTVKSARIRRQSTNELVAGYFPPPTR